LFSLAKGALNRLKKNGGILFRADDVNSKFYYFRLKIDGAYRPYSYQGSVNKQFVAGVSDTDHSYGKIGVFASASTDPTEVIFSDVQVWKIP
jgi:hypothetical protein